MTETIRQEFIPDFESVCRKLHDQLAGNLKSLAIQFNTTKLLYEKLNNIVMGRNARFFSEMLQSTRLIKPGPKDSHLADISGFLDAVEQLSIPEAKTFVQDMRRQRVEIRQTSSKKIARKASEEMIHEKARQAEAISEKDTLRSHFVVYRKILYDRELFSIEGRVEYLRTLDEIESLILKIEDFRLKAASLGQRADKIYDLEENLGNIARSYDSWWAAKKRLAESEKAYETVAKDGTCRETDDPAAFGTNSEKPNPIQKRLNNLEASLEDAKKSLLGSETILKAYFAENSNLIKPIAAVLNNILFLCGGLVKIEIRDISSWEIDMAKRQWPLIREKLPRNHPLSAIDPAAMSDAMDFLIANEDFLITFNSAKHSRARITDIKHELSDIRDKPATGPTSSAIDALAVREQQERRLARLSGTIQDNRARTEDIGRSIADSLELLGKNANISGSPYSIKPSDYWTMIEKSVCDNILNDISNDLGNMNAEMQLTIDAEIQKD